MPEFCRMLDTHLRYYNEERPKEKLGWMSPMQYRRSLGLAASRSKETSAPPSDHFLVNINRRTPSIGW